MQTYGDCLKGSCLSEHCTKKPVNPKMAQLIRKDIIGELEAIVQYQNHIMETDDPVLKKVWEDIRDEEKVHVGELFTLLVWLDPSEEKFFTKGQKEVEEMLRRMGKM